MNRLPHPLDALLIWHRMPDQELAHVRWRFLAASTRTALCDHQLDASALVDDGNADRCPVCQYATETLHEFCLDFPRHQVFSSHPMVAEVHAAFEAAGGRWAALQTGQFDWRAIRREMEAVVRTHIDNPQALLREVVGYLELAIVAAQRQALDAADKEKK